MLFLSQGGHSIGIVDKVPSPIVDQLSSKVDTERKNLESTAEVLVYMTIMYLSCDHVARCYVLYSCV